MYPIGFSYEGRGTDPDQKWIPGIQDQVGQPPVVSTSVVGVKIAPEVILAIANLKCYKRIQKMKPPLLQSGKSEDAYEFMSLFYDMLEVVGMIDDRGVRFVEL